MSRKGPPEESKPVEEFLQPFAQAVKWFGKIYNGFEFHGAQNIPKQGPALIVFYHGLNPLDAWYFGLQYYLDTGRLIRGLGDDWLFKTPGLSWLCRAVGGVPGNFNSALSFLQQGHLVGVSPGGVREAIKGKSQHYQLLWEGREGFARLAMEAKVDIIPAFTQNVEEMYRAPFADSLIIKQIYERTRLPLVPIVGLGLLPFPVKLVTWIGSPIKSSEFQSPKELKDRVARDLQALINSHQRKDISIWSAIKERFY